MNTKIYSILKGLFISMGLLFIFPSCGKFLEEVSQDEVVPTHVSDLSQLLYGEAYPGDNGEASTRHRYLDLMTDDVTCYFGRKGIFGSDTRNEGFGYYTWSVDPEILMSGGKQNDNSWYTYYRQILFANIILNYLPTVAGDQSDKDYLSGEAHAIRAYSYFMLVNLYADPYDKNTAATTLGVPEHTHYTIQDIQMPRIKLSENYATIQKELELSLADFAKSKKERSIFRWNKEAVLLLASRVCLYMKDYESAVKYADELISIRPLLYDLNAKLTKDPEYKLPFINLENPEILYTYGFGVIDFFTSSAYGGFPISQELRKTYEDRDLRYLKGNGEFVQKVGRVPNTRYVPRKSGNSSISKVYGFALRTAEAYLNRAEAKASLGKITEALQDLNLLRKYRIKSDKYTLLEAGTQDEVICLVKEERRRELAFEQHRWFDLRRWDRPEITHIFVQSANPRQELTFVLKKDDPAYTLPIPYGVVSHDPDLIQNNRPERTPVEIPNN